MIQFKTSTVILLALVSWASKATAQVPGAFTSTGNMSTLRAGHTATLLGNGKVLIAGGSHYSRIAGEEVPASAELYDPSTGIFSLTGSMSVLRAFHAAALLPDGKVLIAGGDADGTADLYDPSTGLFSPVGSMGKTTRPQFATALNNGKVLIAGGPFAALFDPSNATFTSLGPLPVKATALTLLADGKVLIQGTDEAGFAGSAHYDPDTGVFSLDDRQIMEPWTIVTATLIASGAASGKVMGTTTATDESRPTGVAEIYDPSTEAFVSRKMAAFRRWATATLLPDSTVLIAGGGANVLDSWWYSATNGAELYDPAADKFSFTGNMAENRERHTVTLLPDGTALIAGGGTAGFGSGSAEIYHPNVLIPAPLLFSLSGNGRGQGAIWHAATGQAASANDPAVAGETLSMYTTNLIEGGVIPPQVAVGGRLAQVLYFGASGYPGYNQVNFRVPSGVAPGPAVPVRLIYLGRPSNEVTIGVQ
jgi:hypothetical protein